MTIEGALPAGAPLDRLWTDAAWGAGGEYVARMRAQRIYVDTFMIGGCFDAGFAVWSSGVLEDFSMGTYRPVGLRHRGGRGRG